MVSFLLSLSLSHSLSPLFCVSISCWFFHPPTDVSPVWGGVGVKEMDTRREKGSFFPEQGQDAGHSWRDGKQQKLTDLLKGKKKWFLLLHWPFSLSLFLFSFFSFSYFPPTHTLDLAFPVLFWPLDQTSCCYIRCDPSVLLSPSVVVVVDIQTIQQPRRPSPPL